MTERPFQFLSLHDAQQRLDVLTHRRNELWAYGTSLLDQFHKQYPDAPAYLTYYSDRTFNDYRWRRSSAKRWRGVGQRAGVNRTFDLLGEDGRWLLAWLPRATRAVWLRYERERVELNRELALVAYEQVRLRAHIDRLNALCELGRNPSHNSA